MMRSWFICAAIFAALLLTSCVKADESADSIIKTDDNVEHTAVFEAKSDWGIEFDKALRGEYDFVEAVYCRSYGYGNSFGEVEQAVFCDPYENEDYTEEGKVAFIADYLHAQELSDCIPDISTSDSYGNPLVDYFKCDDGRSCFVIHYWYYDNGVPYTDGICCTTLYISEFEQTGSIIYCFDENTISESLYNAHDEHIATVTYEYIPEMPFPVITTADYTDDYALTDIICRGSKFMFFEERACFDAFGKIASCGASDYKFPREYFDEPFICIYDENGRLSALYEKPPEHENDNANHGISAEYSGQMIFNYRENGILESVDYWRSSYYHGTFDSGGSISFDENGRMLYNEYYVTHGRHSVYYLYEDGEKQPWACMNFCNSSHEFDNICFFS